MFGVGSWLLLGLLGYAEALLGLLAAIWYDDPFGRMHGRQRLFLCWSTWSLLCAVLATLCFAAAGLTCAALL